MHDILIKGGTVIDGTGQAGFTADVAIQDGRITEVGRVDGPARQTLQADGLLVTPGWVDIHTHYDGQATWDPYMTPSSWHGVTTAVMGNCGVGFAPSRSHQRQWMMDLMEGVEDIPGVVLSEGVQWEWESFPEYLDALDRRPRIMDVAAQVPHCALRVYVMGERGAAREPATPADIETMGRLVHEAVQAGALGFSSSRTVVHRTKHGQAVPTLEAAGQELIEIARAMGRTGKGINQLISDFDDLDGEFSLMREIARQSGRPLSFTLLQHDFMPQRWREVLRRTDQAQQDGLTLRAQVSCRPIGMVHGLECSMHPFFLAPSYLAIADLPVPERVKRMRDPALRARILAESAQAPDNRRLNIITQHFHKLFPIGERNDYEPRPQDSVAGIAERLGRPAAEVAYDMLLEDEGRRKFNFPMYNYTDQSLDVVREMMTHPNALFGLGDAGAHCGYICDASYPTFLLTHWGRDRTRGDKLPLEFLVHGQTLRNAQAMGMHDRGAIRAGMRADINLMDFAQLNLTRPEVTHDLPANGRRLVQHATGYVHTLVAGQVVMSQGEATGALPGRLVRA
ncbi:MAG: amidohydrolase family protein [Limnohabitans sp.]|nr:amidohydrolase family protein [Limnohabitans sp.]